MKIAIIGCGVMGSAFAKKLAQHHEIYLYDRHHEKSQELAASIHGKSFENPQEMIKQSDVIFLAVKPKDFSSLEKLIGPSVSGKWVISMLTGISTSRLQQAFQDAKVVRTMPNLPVLHGAGVVGLVESRLISPEDASFIEGILKPMGIVHWITEDKIDALTALTGSGPAFILYLLESAIDAGILMGFSTQESQKLAIATFKGALALMESGKEIPREIIWKITSAGGTTIAGVHELDEGRVKSRFGKAFIAASKRSKEMSESDY